MFYRIYFLVFLPIISTFDCQRVCSITIEISEHTSREYLQWNLMDLLSNRTASYRTFQYSLSTYSDYFELDSHILKYRLDELDREQLCEQIEPCFLQLEIFTQTSFVILFKLIIIDINDWRPFFSRTYFALTIRENLPTNYQVQLPIAVDYDSDQYNIDRYEFLNKTESIFQLEKSFDELKLNLIQQLDCETKNNYQLFIQAIDKGGLRSNILHVNITVGDLNEYHPSFTQRYYHVHLPENFLLTNQTVVKIIAHDHDCDDRILHYTILNTDIANDLFPFKIDRYTGEIRLRTLLDYETISTYRFRVKASNSNRMISSLVPVIIDILDVNDHAPWIYLNIFKSYQSIETKQEMNVYLNESVHLQQAIGTILIRDLDSMIINHRLTLEIVSCSPSCPIELDSTSPTTYLIRTSKLFDRESNDQKFTIVFQARDYGEPSLSSEYCLIIHINDENDCAPKFSRRKYEFRISNASESGSIIGRVQAFDEDYSPKFRLIEYKLLSNEHEELIRIDAKNGTLVLVQQPSSIIAVNRTIVAFNSDRPSLFDQIEIELIFYDESNCLPMFNQSIYIFNTTEHQTIPYTLGQIYFIDCQLSFLPIVSQMNSLISFPFAIDSSTGNINVIADLDYETQSFYQFELEIFNSESRTRVHIHIFDINDHSPIFNISHEQFIFISLNHFDEHSIFITNILATDADDNLNGLISYYFVNQDLYAYFHLFDNGSIILHNPINIYLPVRLEIYARDHGYPNRLKSDKTIVIYVCDDFKPNECSPTILRRNFYLGSILIMISIASFLIVIMICICWNLYLKNQLQNNRSTTTTTRTFTCRIEPRNNRMLSDSIYDALPTMNVINHRFK